MNDLRENLGVKPGDRIVAHTSLKSIGQVAGGAVTVIEALIEALGGTERGTLMMPCFNGPAEEIDLRSTPCRLGLIPEAFRTYPGVIRSQNWTHSVAVTGCDAKAIAAAHRGREPLGEGSPFHKLTELGGYVLHIGCDMSSCSLVHVAESVIGAPYQHIGYANYGGPVRLIVDDANRYVCVTKEKPGCSKGFTVVQHEAERQGLLTKGSVGSADTLKIKGADVLGVACRLLRKDMAALLCDREQCKVCSGRRAFLAG